MRINFDVAESKKTKPYREQVAKEIVATCSSNSSEKKKDRKCYEYFNLQYKPEDYNYLRKVGPYELPAKVRFIPIARSKFQRLRSTQATRSFDNFKVYSDDERSVIDKINIRVKEYISTIDHKLKQRFLVIQHTKQQIEENMQQVEQLMQNQEGLSPEQQQQLQVVKSQLHQMRYATELQVSQLDTAGLLTDAEIKKINKFYKYEGADIIEEMAQNALFYLIQKLDIKSKNIRAYTDRIVTGKSLFEVHHRPGEKHPYFEKIDSVNTYWSGDEQTEWIQKTRWAARKFDMSVGQMLSMWKRYIDPKLKRKLENYVNGYNPEDSNGFVATQDGKAIDTSNITTSANYSGTRSFGSKETWVVYWRAAREVHVKKSPNPYLSGKYFTHFITEEEAATWNKNEEANREKGEELYVRYVDDLYWAVVVGRNTVLFSEKHPVQLRDPDDYSVELPIIGRTFNSATETPYSLVWATKDIQELYNLVHYHRELMLALAGVKGVVMDHAQMPDEMSETEWLYYKKQGIQYIDSSKVRSGFNQFQNYDDSLPDSIQYLEGMLESLDNMLYAVTGVAREATGRTVGTDQVGTYQMAIEQSGLVAQIEFHEHDEILQKALGRLVNLCHIPWANGVTLAFATEDYGLEAFKIPKNVLKGRRFNLFLKNSQMEEKNINELKQIALNNHAKGIIDLEQIAKLYKLNSLPKLEKEIMAMGKESREIAQKSQEGLEAAKAQAKQQEIDVLKRWEQIFENQKAEIEKAGLAIKERELALKEKQIDLDHKVKSEKNQIDLLDTLTERENEDKMLEESKRSAMATEALQVIQTKLNALLQMNADSDRHVENMGKIEVDKKKAQSMGSKENHVNNN